MRAFLGCAFVVAVLLLTTEPTDAQGIGGLFGTIINATFKETEIYILDHYCTVRRQPYIRKWELHYRAWGELSRMDYYSGQMNANNAEHEATKDFMTQALAAGLVTKEEAAPYLI